MTDLTKITTPFGLLDKATQAALEEHNGPWQWWAGYSWETVSADDGPTFSARDVWRVKPTPTPPREAWSVGAHMHDTVAAAVAFRDLVAASHGEHHYETRIIHWREVLPEGGA